jgi:hypothetical protein
LTAVKNLVYEPGRPGRVRDTHARPEQEETRGEGVRASPAPIVGYSRAECHKQDKRERIPRAARRLFRTKGFERRTTSEIAELPDVGTGRLFSHPKSTGAIASEVKADADRDRIRCPTVPASTSFVPFSPQGARRGALNDP